ncbi:MAG: GNAT family N-acetyltransferase, partial [Cyanobacteriota bacterium]
MDLLAPQPLAPHHSTVGFDCGDAGLNHWLRQRAHSNQQSGATRCFVVCSSDGIVKAYVALASGAVAVASAPGRFRRNMPDPIPVVVLARLAVCRNV